MKFLFAIAMPTTGIRNKLTYVKNLGDLLVTGEGTTAYPEEIEIHSIEFGGVNILPVLQYEETKGHSPVLDEVYEAAVNHLTNKRYEKDIEEENEASNY